MKAYYQKTQGFPQRGIPVFSFLEPRYHCIIPRVFLQSDIVAKIIKNLQNNLLNMLLSAKRVEISADKIFAKRVFLLN